MSGVGDRPVPMEILDGRGFQVGDGNVQVNYFGLEYPGQPVAGEVAGAGPVVVGDVPQEPAAFRPRAGMLALLERGTRVSVVFAVTGARGVGKTQVAAACARRRITDGWRLVAWVDASDEASLLAGLAHVAAAVGVGAPGQDARVLADRVRHWLEADGARCLLVLDNAVDLDGLRPFMPAAGAAQVIITSSRRSAAALGTAVPVDVFTEDEALTFLGERTGLDDAAGARELAAELGFLPLGLAQAAALIAREHLSYGTYMARLRSLPVAGYLGRAEGDAYPYRLAEAIAMSLRAAEDRDSSGVCGRLMGLVAVLAEAGVPRHVLHLAAATGAVGDGRPGPAEVDAGAGSLADASLLGFTAEDSVVAHRLVMRVARERLAAEGKLPAVLDSAVRVLGEIAGGIGDAWRDPALVRELFGQVNATANTVASHPGVLAGEAFIGLLQLRLRSVELLNVLGSSTGAAILAAEPLAADFERVLGAEHPDTLQARNNLGRVYQAAGRMAEAALLYERTLADRERALGADDPDTLDTRNNLAVAFLDEGRTAEAILLLERTLTDLERVLGADHPATLGSRNNLALAYKSKGRIAEAIPLYERTLADYERVVGADYPDTMRARGNLADAYLAVRRTADAVPLYGRTLADFERVLGADHPDTLLARNNLAVAYWYAGRPAEALLLYERALADYERVLGADHPDTERTRHNFAKACLAGGRAVNAVLLYGRTLADRERVLGADHPDTVRTRDILAWVNEAAGRPAEAISLLERTLASRERLLGANHPDTLASLSNLARAYQVAGRPAEAIPLLERTLAGRERVLGAAHPDTLASRNNLAWAYQGAGRPGAAIPLDERTLADFERVLVDGHPGTDIEPKDAWKRWWTSRTAQAQLPER